MTALAQGGGWFGGGIRSARGAGWDRGKPLSAWPTPARWRLWVPPDLPGGRRGYPSSRLVVYRGKPLAAASSSSRSFLEVLIGAGASESWSLVEDPGGRSDREASSFLLIRRCRHLFLLLFLCRFFWA